jgi:hypothetical protein
MQADVQTMCGSRLLIAPAHGRRNGVDGRGNTLRPSMLHSEAKPGRAQPATGQTANMSQELRKDHRFFCNPVNPATPAGVVAVHSRND